MAAKLGRPSCHEAVLGSQKRDWQFILLLWRTPAKVQDIETAGHELVGPANRSKTRVLPV
jgi:hypothetical protein